MQPKLLLLFASLLLGLLGRSVYAQNKTYKYEAGFQTDNDGILGRGSDKYYTAGNFFYFRRALKINKPDSSALQNKILGFELGQKIYTPQSGAIPSSLYVDRPFAGYLYLSSTLNLLYKNESNLKLQAQTGFVGQFSYGREIQNFIHKTLGFYTPAGWQYQIQNDFEINLSAEYNRLLVRSSTMDVSLSSYANLGTGLTGAGLGPLIRIGWFNQLFNSSSTSSSVSQYSRVKPLHKSEFFIYSKPLINYVAYNATIQGSMFNNSIPPHEIVSTLKPIIYSDQVGLSYVKNHWVIDLSAVFQTRETREMIYNHQWGSLSFIYRFN